jgi:hypothetical protein
MVCTCVCVGVCACVRGCEHGARPEVGPLPPLCQLLGVLPLESHSLLPAAFLPLVQGDGSGSPGPLAPYFPAFEDVQVDSEDSKFEWQEILKLPFLPQTELMAAAASATPSLTDEERERNTHGPALCIRGFPGGDGGKGTCRTVAVPGPALVPAVFRMDVVGAQAGMGAFTLCFASVQLRLGAFYATRMWWWWSGGGGGGGGLAGTRFTFACARICAAGG